MQLADNSVLGLTFKKLVCKLSFKYFLIELSEICFRKVKQIMLGTELGPIWHMGLTSCYNVFNISLSPFLNFAILILYLE